MSEIRPKATDEQVAASLLEAVQGIDNTYVDDPSPEQKEDRKALVRAHNYYVTVDKYIS